ncbi:hypothetical protein BJV74DRAFT_125045 [Russula compacta]|nr:hypothetical protein BJV74DRAFT_125045 [Russula compacta]
MQLHRRGLFPRLPPPPYRLYMVNFRDPAAIAATGGALIKFWHVVAGLYFWEFLTSLDFEWRVLRWHRQLRLLKAEPTSYPWTIWLYCLTRVAALVAVIIYLIDLNVTTRINCQAAVIFETIPAYLALATASSLIVLRIKVIWDGNSVMLMIAACIWGINSAFLVLGITRLRSEWVPAGGGGCNTYNIQTTKVTIIVAFVSDILLLIIMLVGLFLRDYHRSDAFGWGRLLWKQGVIWLLLATVAGILPTVFVCLDLNDPLSVIFQLPWLLTMTMAATRMYRALKYSDIFGSRAPVEALPNGGPGRGDAMFIPQYAPPRPPSVAFYNLEAIGRPADEESASAGSQMIQRTQ